MGAAETAMKKVAYWSRPLVANGLLVGLVTALALSTLIFRMLEGPEIPAAIRFDFANVVAVALVLAGISSLMWQRPAALPLLAVGVTVLIGYGLSGSVPPLLAFAPLMALYAVAANSRPAVSGIAAGVLAVGAAVVFFAIPGPMDDDVLDYVLSIATAWLLGYGVRLSRVRTALLDDQAAQLARERVAKTETAIREEQNRIARELHDIVAHRVVVIVAQAGASKRSVGSSSEQVCQTLTSIETLGREALIEMRRLVGVLSTDNGSKAPQPELAELPSLIGQIEQAGLAVHLRILGDARALPAGVELNAYRIVQEALTNVLKHASASHATVELAYRPRCLELHVADDGRGSSLPLTPGQGLVGMRERVALLGGELTVGPRAGTGFEVAVKLPVNGEAA